LVSDSSLIYGGGDCNFTRSAMTTSEHQDQRTIEVRSPADGRTVGTVPDEGLDRVTAVATALRAAQPEWEDLGPDGRKRVMLRWADWFLDNERRLGELVQAESGKAWVDASLEPTMSVELINHYAKHAKRYLSVRDVRRHGPIGLTKRLEVRYRPYPLVGIITPWNGPIGAPMLDTAAALMAGAAVLTKPSEITPLAWREAVRGFVDEVAGPPVLACVTGGGGAGAAVVDEVDMVMFTGSTRTGRAIAQRCAGRLIPCSLELGGKDPMIVLADADIDRAVQAAVWGGMFNSGQACVSVERVYVEAPAYDEFVAKATAAVQAVRQGTDAPGAFEFEVGAMATSAQLEVVERHVRDAVDRGARVTVGGHRCGSGNYFEPTVLVNVDHSMLCMREETFGPTLPIMKVADEVEAVRLANDSHYGLSASVFAGDVERARRVSARLEVGAVNLNNALVNLFHFNLPQGGWKQSGLGSRFGGEAGLLKFCRAQAVVSDRVTLPEPYWFPTSTKKGKMIARGARFMGANDWRRRLGR
jgi:acyl-CoA reductase-like NAD-dependent aldehyde dehydrogenase